MSGAAGGFSTGGGLGGGQAMHRPRSIRRLMSEKSFTMDTVYSGMVLDSDLPSEPLEVRLPSLIFSCALSV